MTRPGRRLVLATALAVALLLTGCGGASGGSPGKRVFDTGSGHAGAIPRATMGAPYSVGGPPCAGCHGATGQGSGIGPSITAATLGTKHTITHKPSSGDPAPQPVAEGPWTTQQSVDAVRTGVTPEGNHLGGRMPKWQLDPTDASALAQYLGQL